jgi:hypothetical protein
MIGDDIVLEDILILHAVAIHIRQAHPTIGMGIHVLSSNEVNTRQTIERFCTIAD